MPIKIKFWGIRGSIPSPLTKEKLQTKIKQVLQKYELKKNNKSISQFINSLPFYFKNTYGGNTSCVEVNDGKNLLILDAGSGIRELGLDLLKRKENYKTIHIFLSHTHWDHIMGFPFFIPSYIKNTNIIIYSAFKDNKERFEYQQDFRFFPVSLENMGANIKFKYIDENKSVNISEIKIKTIQLHHPGNSYGFSIETKNKKIVYATDNEIYGTPKEKLKKYIEFIKKADILIFDAQYTLKETLHKITWGHSSATMGIEIALEGNVKNLILFHFDPTYSDKMIYDNIKSAKRYLKIISRTHRTEEAKNLKIYAAYEGMTLTL